MGVRKEIISPGEEGQKPVKGDTIAMGYIGTLAADGKQFDASYDRGQDFVTQIGMGQVIKGWDEGILDPVNPMLLGEKAKLFITSDYAYGTRAIGDIIPANSDLIFEVQLLAINGKRMQPPTTTSGSNVTSPATGSIKSPTGASQPSSAV